MDSASRGRSRTRTRRGPILKARTPVDQGVVEVEERQHTANLRGGPSVTHNSLTTLCDQPTEQVIHASTPSSTHAVPSLRGGHGPRPDRVRPHHHRRARTLPHRTARQSQCPHTSSAPTAATSGDGKKGQPALERVDSVIKTPPPYACATKPVHTNNSFCPFRFTGLFA